MYDPVQHGSHPKPTKDDLLTHNIRSGTSVFRSRLEQCPDKNCNNLNCLYGHICTCCLHKRLIPGCLTHLAYYKMPNGDISKICCAARDTNEHNNSLRSELLKSDISSFLNASVRDFKNKHAHMLVQSHKNHSATQSGIICLKVILHCHEYGTPMPVNENNWRPSDDPDAEYSQLFEQVCNMFVERKETLHCVHSHLPVTLLSQSGESQMVFDVMYPSRKLDEKKSNAIAVSRQDMNAFYGPRDVFQRNEMIATYSMLLLQTTLIDVESSLANGEDNDDDTDGEERGEITQQRYREMYNNMVRRESITTDMFNNPEEHPMFHANEGGGRNGRNAGHINKCEFQGTNDVKMFVRAHGSRCVVSDNTMDLCIDRILDSGIHSPKDGHCHLLTIDINRMKACYPIFFNKKSLDDYRQSKGITQDKSNSDIVRMVLRPILLQLIEYRNHVGPYTEYK